jgi:spore coat polysaccharide biosynthesis protein SpsF
MTVAAIVQARVASTRLPGKVLAPIGSEPMIARVVDRVARAQTVTHVIVATTTQSEDNSIADLAASRGWASYRGSVQDVLDRYHGAAKEFGADVVVRITSDCPLIDPNLIDAVVAARDVARADYASNSLEPRTYPRGLDVEAFTYSALQRAWLQDSNPEWREHVTPYFYRNPDLFTLERVANGEPLGALRWCVDTDADLEFVRLIWDALPEASTSWRDVLDVTRRHPEWTAINSQVRQKVVP